MISCITGWLQDRRRCFHPPFLCEESFDTPASSSGGSTVTITITIIITIIIIGHSLLLLFFLVVSVSRFGCPRSMWTMQVTRDISNVRIDWLLNEDAPSNIHAIFLTLEVSQRLKSWSNLTQDANIHWHILYEWRIKVRSSIPQVVECFTTAVEHTAHASDLRGLEVSARSENWTLTTPMENMFSMLDAWRVSQCCRDSLNS